MTELFLPFGIVLQHAGIAWFSDKFFGLKGDILESRKPFYYVEK